jgi:hypothetical protein
VIADDDKSSLLLAAFNILPQFILYAIGVFYKNNGKK